MPSQPHDLVVEIRAATIFNAPFFASIMFERGLVETTDENGLWRGHPVPTAMTDGRHIVFNMGFMTPLTKGERLFVACHEVFHLMSRHPTRMKYYHHNGLFGQKFDMRLANIAMDAVINKCLRDAGIGKMPDKGVNLEPELKEKGYLLSGTEAWEDVYKVLLENPDIAGPAGQPMGDGPLGAMEGDVGDPSMADGEIPSEAEMKASIKSAAEAAKATGKLPGNMLSLIDELLEPVVDWREQLKTMITTYADPDHYDWSRVNRHKVVAPGLIMPRMVGQSCGPVAIAIDTSGSVSDHELKEFISEVSAILSECRPSRCLVIWCDAQVDRVDQVNTPEDLLALTRAEGVPGRGGTSFVPPFVHLAEKEASEDWAMIIYMTDGYGPFPTESQAIAPTIWLINNDQVTPPFGQHIVLKTR